MFAIVVSVLQEFLDVINNISYLPALYVWEILGKLLIVVTVSYIVLEHESPKLYAKKTVSLAEKGLLLDGVHPKYVSLLIEIVEFSQI